MMTRGDETTDGGDDHPQAPDLKTFFEGHHRGLRNRLARILSAVVRPLPGDVEGRAQWKVEVATALAALRGFAETHFADEEKLMEDVAYPGATDHARQHRAFLDWLDRCEALIDTDCGQLRRETRDGALLTWWETHATDYDTSLADFLCRGGI